MTQASIEALKNLRDLSTIKWYAVPLLVIVIYIYVMEVKRARTSGDWNGLFAGLTLFGMDFINETWNGWVLNITGYSAFWTVPGDTALRTLVGWNIEIMFMFAISGVAFYHLISENRNDRILGIPDRWFWAVNCAIFCVFIEVILNIGGHLVWVYPFWNSTFAGVWLIFLFGYFIFFAAVNIVIMMKSNRNKIITITAIYGIAIIGNIVGLGILGWNY